MADIATTTTATDTAAITAATTAATTATPTTATAAGLETFIGADGALKAGWTQAWGAPDTFGKFTNIKSLVGSHVSLEKMIGADKVVIPTANTPPEQAAAFWQKLGVPEKVEGYNLAKPEKLGDKALPDGIWDDARAQEFAKFAHAHHIPAETARALAEWDLQRGMEDRTRFEQALETQRGEAETALKTEWGTRYETNLGVAEKASRAFGFNGSEHPELANDPEFIRLMFKAGGMMSESTLNGARQSSAPVQDARQQIAAIRADKTHPYNDLNPKTPSAIRAHQEAVLTMQRLYKEAFPEGA